MQISLSPRLQCCASFIHPGDRVADIGCDHGYLSIYLVTQGISPRCIASDIRPGPLESAIKNAAKFGVSQNISFFLSDGMKSIPRDFDTAVIAGMGADVMESILTASPWLTDGSYRLILQCQSRTPFLRSYLSRSGWQILRESVVRDGRFLYTVMEVVRGQMPLSPAQCWFPPALLVEPTPETAEYYDRVLNRLRIAAQGSPELENRILELKRLEDTVNAYRT